MYRLSDNKRWSHRKEVFQKIKTENENSSDSDFDSDNEGWFSKGCIKEKKFK